MSWDEVLWERSFLNIMMLGKSIPDSGDSDSDKKKVTKKGEMSGADLFNRFKK